MILHLFRRDRRGDTIAVLYGTIVAQARSPEFYLTCGVPDTVAGRLDMIILHIFLVLRRLGDGTEAGRGLGQGLFDLFCRDMDDNLREMGIGDMAVPKHMLRFGEAFFGRRTAYAAALAHADDKVLIEALARNIYATSPEEATCAPLLAHYVRSADRQLAECDDRSLQQGIVAFPIADSVAAGPRPAIPSI
jgi:cytochrome b pre-mRNA-processing protein 3